MSSRRRNACESKRPIVHAMGDTSSVSFGSNATQEQFIPYQEQLDWLDDSETRILEIVWFQMLENQVEAIQASIFPKFVLL